MNRVLLVFAILFTPTILSAQSSVATRGEILTASLSGQNTARFAGDPDGFGLATLLIDPTASRLYYTVTAKNIATPAQMEVFLGSSITDPRAVAIVREELTFVNGVATGSIALSRGSQFQNNLDTLLANGEGLVIKIVNSEFAALAAISGVTSSVPLIGSLTLPVIGRVEGAAGTLFRSDVRIANQSAFPTQVTLDYFASSSTGQSGPSATSQITLAPRELKVLDDILKGTFNLDVGLGALRVTSTREVEAVGRIYNDQRTTGKGTFGQFEVGMSTTDARIFGILPMLSNQPASTGSGFRSNIGWFNPQPHTVFVAFTAYRPDGTLISSVERLVASLSHEQMPVASLIAALAEQSNFYISFQARVSTPANLAELPSALFVYASVVDNVNGDAIFIPALKY